MRFQTITPARRRDLKPGDSLTEHNITVLKLANGDERWSLALMYLGIRRKKVLGLGSERWNATKALEVRDQIRADIREGLNTVPVGRKVAMRFSELAKSYLLEMETSGGRNLKRKRLHLERRLIPKLGGLVVENMTEEHVAHYRHDMLENGFSSSTVNRDLSTLNHVLSTAVKRRKLRRMPCAVEKLAEPEGRTVVLSDEQCAALVDAAKRDSHPLLWLFIEFGLGTGMRSSEIVSARFENIDWDKCRLYLPKAKAGDRTQPLTRSLVEILRKERDGRSDREGWIFPSTRTANGYVNEFNGPFKRAVKEAGLSPTLVTPHVMRHTAATKMVAAGHPIPSIQKVTGHKTPHMLLRYVHMADRDVNAAVSALDRHHAEAGAD